MKVRLYAILISLAGGILCATAQSEVDSLRQQLKRQLPDTVLFETLIQLASLRTHSHPDTTLLYTQRALVVAERINDPSRLATAYNRLGAGYWSTGDLRKGLSYFQQSMQAAEKAGDLYLYARNIGNIGLIYSSSGNYETAIDYYRESLPHFQILGEQERIAVTYNNMGKGFLELEGHTDSAVYYLTRSRRLAETARPNILPIITFNLADAYYRIREFEKALPILQECLEYQATYEDLRSLIRANQLLAEIDIQNQQLDSAVVRANRAVALAETSSVKELRYLSFETLSHVLAATGAHQQAYQYHVRYTAYKDSIQNQRTQTRLDFYEYERKQQEIAFLKQEREYERERSKRRSLLIVGLVAGLILTSVLGGAFFRSQQVAKRSNQTLRRQHQEIGAQKEALTIQAQQLTELNTVKDRLFSIISHDLRSPLRNLTELLRFVKESEITKEQFQQFIPDLAKKVDMTTNLLDTLLLWAESQMEGVRVHQRPFDLHTLVKRKVDLMLAQARQKGIRLQHTLQGPLLVFADSNMIDIVLQNLIANAIKFSEADDEIRIQAHQIGQLVEVTIRDTGIGISPGNMSRLFKQEGLTTLGTQQEQGTGLGLALCKEFVEKNGGTIWAESTEGEGSTFGFTLSLCQEVIHK